MPDTLPDLTRDGLPPALRVLVEEYPREAWEAHPEFAGLVQFWLERHMMFRKLGDLLQQDIEGLIDGGMGPRAYGGRLSRFGGMLINQLHGHHQIEDMHYFPALKGFDPRLERGFDILDRDHHEIDPMLHRFAEAANGLLGRLDAPDGFRDAAGSFHGEVEGVQRVLSLIHI